ncbi:MAG TPA: iron-containing alcohol dehydrogenase [Candidatus Thermoplasmatota archaeon]|nr:iron-containing alcohol dehydrogenase [Candidatus Thermoplasmatota archaeon]
MTVVQFSFPTTIRFGPGASREVASHLAAQGLHRPLVVTDAGLAKLPLLTDFAKALSGAAVFSDIAGNPGEGHVASGVDAYRAHRADCIVGIGGGAALDVAKAIALMVHHPGAILDYEDASSAPQSAASPPSPAGDGWRKPDARPVDKEIPYWVALPTTSGTGSEVGRSTVISDAHHVKRIIFHPRLLARAVFADPALTLDLPPKITAATGMDAITHCVESYLAKDHHPICDGIALEGLRLASRALPRAVAHGSDMDARRDMMMASMMGAIAFQKGLGVAHSCAHALSAVADLHHGLACAMMIDHAIAMNVPAREERFREMARVVGAKEQTAASFLRWLADLKAEIGIPARLTQAGVTPEHLIRLPDAAFADSCHQNNPVPVTTQDLQRIFHEAA